MPGSAKATRTVTYLATAEPESWAATRGVGVDEVPDDLAAYLAEATNAVGLPAGVVADIVAMPVGSVRRMLPLDEIMAEIERMKVLAETDTSAGEMLAALQWVVGVTDSRPSASWEE